MKIVEVKCQDCDAEYEILENFPREMLACPACKSKKLAFTNTDREFNGCGGSCSSCSTCE